MSPELATALVAFALIVALAVVIRHLRDRAELRRRSQWTGWTDPTAGGAELVDPAPDGHREVSAPTRIVVAGAHPAEHHVPPPLEDEPPRIQLIRDASAVGIAIIVVLLLGPLIFASRTGGVLGETFAPDDAAAVSEDPGRTPNAEAPPGSEPLDGEAVPSLEVPAVSPTPVDPGTPGTPGPRPTPNPGGNVDPTPTPLPAASPTPKPTPKPPKPSPTPTPTPTPEPPTPTPEPPTPTPEPPTPTPEPTP